MSYDPFPRASFVRSTSPHVIQHSAVQPSAVSGSQTVEWTPSYFQTTGSPSFLQTTAAISSSLFSGPLGSYQLQGTLFNPMPGSFATPATMVPTGIPTATTTFSSGSSSGAMFSGSGMLSGQNKQPMRVLTASREVKADASKESSSLRTQPPQQWQPQLQQQQYQLPPQLPQQYQLPPQQPQPQQQCQQQGHSGQSGMMPGSFTTPATISPTAPPTATTTFNSSSGAMLGGSGMLSGQTKQPMRVLTASREVKADAPKESSSLRAQSPQRYQLPPQQLPQQHQSGQSGMMSGSFATPATVNPPTASTSTTTFSSIFGGSSMLSGQPKQPAKVPTASRVLTASKVLTSSREVKADAVKEKSSSQPPQPQQEPSQPPAQQLPQQPEHAPQQPSQPPQQQQPSLQASQQQQPPQQEPQLPLQQLLSPSSQQQNAKTGALVNDPAAKMRKDDLQFMRSQVVADLMDSLVLELLQARPTEGELVAHVRRWAVRQQVDLLGEGTTDSLQPSQDSKKTISPSEAIIAVVEGVFANSKDPLHWLQDYINNLKEEACVGIAVESTALGIDTARKAQAPTAFVLDCGTGETKILLYTFFDGTISVEELYKLGPASDYLEEPEKFAALVGVYFKKHNASTALVAASAWMRNADGDKLTKAHKLLDVLMSAGIICKVLEQTYEAWMEAVSIEYISYKKDLGLTSTWASGGGSTQFSVDFAEVGAVPLGSREGIEFIKAHGPQEGSKRWTEKILTVLNGVRKQFPHKLHGRIGAISGVFFAAQAAKLKDGQWLPAAQVQATFQQNIETLQKSELDKKGTQNLSNLLLQSIILREMVESSSEIYFMRDLKLDGKDFRVTWSSGWYINLLGVVNAMPEVTGKLQSIAHLQKVINPEKKLEDIKAAQAQAAAHALCGLERVMKVMFERAHASEELVTPILEKICKSTGGSAHLEGLQYKLKSKESLSRKLRTRLSNLLTRHKYEPFYIPKLGDVIKDVDDILRYTIVSDDTCYTQVIKQCLDQLKKIEKFEKINKESYWMQDNTYYGVTCWITRDGFTFELQLHTKYSWHVKQSTAHDLYEIFRLLHPSDAKAHLFKAMKDIWDPKKIPKDLDIEPKPFADQMMTQFLKVKEFAQEFQVGLEDQEKRLKGEPGTIPRLRRLVEVQANKVEGLCGRLMRGKDPCEFEWLALMDSTTTKDGPVKGPGDKRVAWFSGPEVPQKFLMFNAPGLPKMIADNMGKSLDWVHEKLDAGYRWRLAVLPQLTCKKADWDGLLEIVIVQFPEVAPIVARFSEALKATEFSQIQSQLPEGGTFRKIKNNGLQDPRYMNIERLRNVQNPQLWHVRGFFYNVIGANEFYKGDGHLYNEKGEKQGTEFVSANQRIADVKGCILLPPFPYIPRDLPPAADSF